MNEVLKENLLHWRYAGIAFLVAYLGVILVLFSTSESFVFTWLGGETYNHGFVILPISLWLVWQKRHELAKVVPEPVALPLVGVALMAVVWMLGALAGIQIVEHISFVFMLIGISMAILGWRLSAYLAFPLLFLLFAVPMGEELVPAMMEYTATFTVEALRLTGIPVYREGMWFVLPTGNWSVVEACSGVRYIIASVTLGFLYAYISYHTLWKRLAFIAISALLPILANGVRAYGIVMIGHLSDMELATGVDHLIYGWIFFGVVMLLLFWIGGFWEEEHPPLAIRGAHDAGKIHNPAKSVVLALSGVLIVAAAQAGQLYLSEAKALASTSLEAPQASSGWQLIEGTGKLEPTYSPTDFILHQAYRGRGGEVSLFVAYYPNQSQGHEAVAERNLVVGNKRGKQQTKSLPPIQPKTGVLDSLVDQSILVRSKGLFSFERLLVWHWYRIGGKELNGRVESKLHEILARLLEGRGDGAWIAIATPLSDADSGQAEARLEAFVEDMYPAITRSMDDVLMPQR